MYEIELPQNTVQPHICLSAKDAAPYALLPGDPERVNRIAARLDGAREIAFNREYKSCTGYYKGIKIVVLSTGIGGTSTGIAVEELSRIGVKIMIRVGSCGAIQPKLQLGDLLIASGAVRNDGASRSYVDPAFPAVPDPLLFNTLFSLAPTFGKRIHIGLIRSHDSFYTDDSLSIDAYWAKKGILGSDNESAALFVIGALRGVRTASILNTVVTSAGDLAQSVTAYTTGAFETTTGECQATQLALDTIEALNRDFQPPAPSLSSTGL